MSRVARRMADYPFAEVNLESTVRELDGFVADPPLTARERGEVLEFVRLTHQYAFFERLIQGEILFDLPVHMDLLSVGDPPLAEQAEASARTERELLALGMEPAVDLLEALDDRGIKMFRRSRGPEPPEVLTGGFYYAGVLGPALLGGCCEGSPEAAFVLAHEYGHLVMDVDPYASRFCRWRKADLENCNNSVEERRADRFARALLLPEDVLRSSGSELGLEDASGQAITRAAEVFDVAAAVLWRRLEDLALPRTDAAPPVRSNARRRKVDELRPTDLPARFVNLVLAAFSRRFIEKREMARFLRIPPERLEAFLRWCPIPRDLRREDFLVGDDGEEPPTA